MGSSGAAMISPTVPARNPGDGEAGAARCVARPSACHTSEGGLAGPLDLCGQIRAQTVVVMLKVFDHGLEVAHPRSEPITLQHEAVIEIHPLTQ